MSFTGKRVLVTGGGRGIGYTIAKRLYEEGAIVFVIDKDQSLLDSLVKEMPKISTYCLDVLDWDLTKKTVLSMAPLDHLVNNAGALRVQPLLEADEESIDLQLGVNIKAGINVSQAFVKGIIEKKSGGGSIVNISSLADRVGFGGAGIYATTKAAVTRYTMAMGLEFAQYNVRVNCISPSFIATKFITELPPEVIEGCKPLMSRTLIPDPITTDDVADTTLFLLSSKASKITGTSIVLDGGLRAN